MKEDARGRRQPRDETLGVAKGPFPCSAGWCLWRRCGSAIDGQQTHSMRATDERFQFVVFKAEPVFGPQALANAFERRPIEPLEDEPFAVADEKHLPRRVNLQQDA